MSKSFTYADAGVDIDKANSLVQTIKKMAKTTSASGVMGEIGGFGALFALDLKGIKEPVLVSSTDGVGTKLKIAFMLNKHDSIGIDLVAMCVNDILIQGAKPLFFLDYFSIGKLDNTLAASVISGITEGCRQAGCALIGGETAEMPGFYSEGEYDLAGFAVGLVDKDKIIDGSKVKPGSKLIGIASSGLHSNGFSLVRKICFEGLGLSADSYVEDLKGSLGDVLLKPTRIYVTSLLALMEKQPVLAMAHITGGGIPENIIRVLPEDCKAGIDKKSWELPPVFSFLQKAGKVEENEMFKTFNMGIGMIVIVDEKDCDSTLTYLKELGEEAFVIGEVRQRELNEDKFFWID